MHLVPLNASSDLNIISRQDQSIIKHFSPAQIRMADLLQAPPNPILHKRKSDNDMSKEVAEERKAAAIAVLQSKTNRVRRPIRQRSRYYCCRCITEQDLDGELRGLWTWNCGLLRMSSWTHFQIRFYFRFLQPRGEHHEKQAGGYF